MTEPLARRINNETATAEAFSRQSVVFDAIYSPNLTIQYKRQRVRAHVERYLKPHSRILELNAGTGEDTVYFAQQGHQVHATDIAVGMLEQLRQKVHIQGLDQVVSTEECSYTALHALKQKGPYDLIFSNLAGLNCTDKLGEVLLSFDVLLAPGGIVSLVILPPFCLWELALALRGNTKAAFRRLGSKKGSPAHIEGVHFTCWYYRPSFIVNTLKDRYELLDTEGLCTIVPPSYFEHFPEKRPKLFRFLQKWEERLKRRWPWKSIGDYYIISLRKKDA